MSTSFDESDVIHFEDVTLKQTRIARLKQLQADRQADGVVEFARLIGKKPQQTADLLAGRASFGEKVARSIEVNAGLRANWLDESEDGWPFPDIDRGRFFSLRPDQRLEIQGVVRGLILEFEGRVGSGESSNSGPTHERRSGT